MATITLMKGIVEDTYRGLTSTPKYLLPRNLYDDRGSRIFQDIMAMPEYYLTNCEEEIFRTQKQSILDSISFGNRYFDLIELGSGDGMKTRILLSYFQQMGVNFSYIPVDISAKANRMLKDNLRSSVPDLNVEPRTGNYFDVLAQMQKNSAVPKTILFLGANIGNFSVHETRKFLSEIARLSNPGDKLLIGFDLKKSPAVIMEAYHDRHGHTRRFNLNHLTRINRELGADFITDNFEHHTSYDPVSGALRSFLVSKKDHTVTLKDPDMKISFKKWEPLYMELSQKFSLSDINELANENGFRVLHHFLDSRGYFTDSLWEIKNVQR
ncbi:L-histidine N(alpha)-methyltransferase [Saccharicrinis sp. FJH54]|uniref:L-histidine N(alpha)-methyltransferase n=1 Tax=Saccharicrinis sp. FJH54 TaxID=3344665 RepID=UPI0035D45790